MVIYEVNLNIDNDIYPDFMMWLKKHVEEMLTFPGFMQASLLKPDEEATSTQEAFTVQYQLKRRADLQRYFTEFAPGMREEGIKRFGGKFSAKRRVYELQEVV
ncbi:MAG: DUF4286 family protein [Legionellaceae bacterium]|nr:DUF4286 family protein [Legionellaceae bacterium]